MRAARGIVAVKSARTLMGNAEIPHTSNRVMPAGQRRNVGVGDVCSHVIAVNGAFVDGREGGAHASGGCSCVTPTAVCAMTPLEPTHVGEGSK